MVRTSQSTVGTSCSIQVGELITQPSVHGRANNRFPPLLPTFDLMIECVP